MRQSLDVAHRQRRAIEKEEGAAGGAVIAPQLGRPILAHQGGAAEGGLQGDSGHVHILAGFAARRGAGNDGGRRAGRIGLGGGTACDRQGGQKQEGAMDHARLLPQQALPDKPCRTGEMLISGSALLL
jgi:hypothetical protein